MKRELEVPGGYIQYEIKENGAVLTGFGGRIVSMDIPDDLEDTPVTEIYKKAFFGAKSLKSVSLGCHIEKIGEWAFASCSEMTKWEVKRKDDSPILKFAQGVFQKDNKLKVLDLGKGSDIAALMAAVPTQMGIEYLIESYAQSETEWLAGFDRRMLEILNEDDTEGYHKMILCGEEDLDADIDVYRNKQQRRKSEIFFLRLLHPTGLQDFVRMRIADYLKQHTLGCESAAAWEVIRDVHAQDKEYYELFLKLDMITEDNFEAALRDLSDRHAELKARMIEYHDEKSSGNDFFDSLVL